MTDRANPANVVEARDALHHLVANGFRPLLQALNQPQVYTSGGRVNLTAVARELGVTPQRASKLLAVAREALE